MKSLWRGWLWIFWAAVLAGCGPQSQDQAWNDYFRLFQEGSKMSGMIKAVQAVPDGTSVEIEYMNPEGTPVSFKENWPAGIPAVEGALVDFYRLENNTGIQQASAVLLKQKKIA